MRVSHYTSEQWAWLMSVDSLTDRLRHVRPGAAGFQLIKSGWDNTIPEENHLLMSASPQKKAWVREILHLQNNEPCVWARAVIPASTIEKTGLDVKTTEPLGDILFSDPTLKRTNLTLDFIPSGHLYFKHAQDCLLQKLSPPLSMRRSLLWFQKQPLYIAEVFLPFFFSDVITPS